MPLRSRYLCSSKLATGVAGCRTRRRRGSGRNRIRLELSVLRIASPAKRKIMVTAQPPEISQSKPVTASHNGRVSTERIAPLTATGDDPIDDLIFLPDEPLSIDGKVALQGCLRTRKVDRDVGALSETPPTLSLGAPGNGHLAYIPGDVR